MLSFKTVLRRKLLTFKETTNFPEAEQVCVIWTCVIDSSSYRTLQNPVCYYSERTSGIHKDIGWQDSVLNESRERFIYQIKVQNSSTEMSPTNYQAVQCTLLADYNVSFLQGLNI